MKINHTGNAESGEILALFAVLKESKMIWIIDRQTRNKIKK